MFEIGRLTRLNLGRVGENNARVIEIDVAEWLADWPGAAVGMLLRRPLEDSFYPAAVEVENGVMRYTVKRGDVQIPGDGMAQIVLIGDGDVELRSRMVRTEIEESMPGSESDAPNDVMQPFVDQLLEAADRAETGADRAETAAAEAADNALIIKDALTGYVKSVNGETPDENGNVEIEAVGGGGGAALTVDPDGNAVIRGGDASPEEVQGAVDAALEAAKASGAFKGDPGEPGAPGEPGEPGYTPVKGKDYFDGADGEDGKTPVRGVDYWTEADREQIVDEVLGQVEAPDMDDYYTKTETDAKIQAAVGSGGGGGGSTSGDGKYVLIEEYTATEDVIFSRTKEPDGTPYALKAVFVKCNGTSATGTRINISFKQGTATIAVSSFGTQKGLKTYSAIEVMQKHGYWEAYDYGSSTSYEQYTDVKRLGDYYAMDKTVENYPYITKIEGNSYYPLQAGMTIKIWGIRA